MGAKRDAIASGTARPSAASARKAEPANEPCSHATLRRAVVGPGAGQVMVSTGNGATWQRQAEVDMISFVVRSDDEGRTWTVLYQPA